MADKINTGGPAFPEVLDIRCSLEQEFETEHGATLRDYFAKAALNAVLSQEGFGIVANSPYAKVGNSGGRTFAQYWARDAYAIADAMLVERENKF